jgi:serine/threonine protein kinase
MAYYSNETSLTLISEEEINSLECPNYESQKANWLQLLKQINENNLKQLLNSIDLDLVEFSRFDQSCGILNQLYCIKANTRDEHSSEKKNLFLKVLNVDRRFTNRKTCEAPLINFIKEKTTIPVPNILSFSYDSSKSLINCEYILMEKLEGVLLKEILPKQVDQVPDTIIDQLIEYSLEFDKINLHENQIGTFGVELNLQPMYPCVLTYDNYLDYFSSFLNYNIGEMTKIGYLRELAQTLNSKRDELHRKATDSMSKCNRLDFEDKICFTHTDLNSTNIIVDPKTLKITGIIDWELSASVTDERFYFFEQW